MVWFIAAEVFRDSRFVHLLHIWYFVGEPMVNKTEFDILIIETKVLLGKRWEVAGCSTFYLFLINFAEIFKHIASKQTKLNNKSLFFLQKEDYSWKFLSQLLLTCYFILVCLNENYFLFLILFIHGSKIQWPTLTLTKLFTKFYLC